MDKFSLIDLIFTGVGLLWTIVWPIWKFFWEAWRENKGLKKLRLENQKCREEMLELTKQLNKALIKLDPEKDSKDGEKPKDENVSQLFKTLSKGLIIVGDNNKVIVGSKNNDSGSQANDKEN